MSGSGYPSYMGYEPYQMSFDNYVPPPGYEDMEEIVSAGNVPVEESNSVTAEPQPTAAASNDTDETENVEDDMDDLRMLGIDLDDVAVVRR